MGSVDDEGRSQPRLVESAAIGLPDETERVALQHVGQASACDVWFSVPPDWEFVLLKLYGKLGSLRVLLHSVAIRDAGGITLAGRLSGIALSLRGRPCASFELTAQRGPGDPLTDGRFVAQFWSDQQLPSVAGGAPFGEIGFTPTTGGADIALVAGKATDSGDPSDRFKLLRVDSSGALHVVAPDPLDVTLAGTLAVEGTGTSGTPTGRILTVQGPNAGVLAVSATGTGTAGSPAGGVLTVQGPSGGTLQVAGGGSSGSPSGGVLSVQGVSGGTGISVEQGLGTGDSANTWVVQLSDGDTFHSDSYPLPVKVRRPLVAYSASTGIVTGPTTVSTAVSLGYLWRSASLKVEIVRILVSWQPGSATAGELSIRGARITAQHASPMGTTPTPERHDIGDGSAGAVFRAAPTGAPTRSSTDMFVVTTRWNQSDRYEWNAESFGKPIVLRAGQSEGFEVRAFADVAIATAGRARRRSP